LRKLLLRQSNFGSSAGSCGLAGCSRGGIHPVLWRRWLALATVGS
jgi:hypothetical protein